MKWLNADKSIKTIQSFRFLGSVCFTFMLKYFSPFSFTSLSFLLHSIIPTGNSIKTFWLDWTFIISLSSFVFLHSTQNGCCGCWCVCVSVCIYVVDRILQPTNLTWLNDRFESLIFYDAVEAIFCFYPWEIIFCTNICTWRAYAIKWNIQYSFLLHYPVLLVLLSVACAWKCMSV